MLLFGGTADGATHAQPAQPHANAHNFVNIWSIHSIFAVLDSPFQGLHHDAITGFWVRVRVRVSTVVPGIWEHISSGTEFYIRVRY